MVLHRGAVSCLPRSGAVPSGPCLRSVWRARPSTDPERLGVGWFVQTALFEAGGAPDGTLRPAALAMVGSGVAGDQHQVRHLRCESLSVARYLLHQLLAPLTQTADRHEFRPSRPA